MTRITRADMVAAVRSRRRAKGRDLEIECDAVEAIAYRDLMETYLALSRVRSWKWIDSMGGESPRQSLAISLASLVRDAAAWPFIYARGSRTAGRLLRAPRAPANLGSEARLLFLRTDHWFGLESGGSVAHLAGVIGAFRALGFETHVASTDILPGVEHDDFFHLHRPVYGLGRNLPQMPEIAGGAELVRWADERWDQWRPSFIYQRYSLGNCAGAVLARRRAVPFVCEYNGSFPWMARNWQGRRLLHEGLVTRIELACLRSARLIVVVSSPMKDELLRRGIEADAILVNPNGVDTDRCSPAIDGSPVRRRLGLEGKTVIGFVGTFGKWHGAEVLAEAFGRLLAQRPAYREQVRLLMVGDGPTLQLVRDKLDESGALPFAVFAGRIRQDEGPAHMAACDILASPHVPNPDGTPFFGSPTKLFEYMAMGKPIVASRLDQIGEVLEHDVTAWLVEPDDPEALALGLKKLTDDPGLRSRLGAAARRQAEEKHTWTEHTRRIIERLRERCGRR